MLEKLLRFNLRGAVAVIVIACLVVIAALPATRWRVAILVLKTVGQLGDLEWRDLSWLLAPESGIRLSRLVHYRDPYTVIENPLGGPNALERGGEIFAQSCARCHGDAAQGGVGPALVGRSLTHGDSDWAMFRTIRGGVPGTAMQAWGLSGLDTWRVIYYLRRRNFENGRKLAAAAGSRSVDSPSLREVAAADLASAQDNLSEWLLPSGSYSSQRFARDTQISDRNVNRLTVQWIHQFDTKDEVIETVPIVVGDRMYVTLPHGSVLALDARSGTKIWEYDREIPAGVRVCCLTTNRGVAVLGRRVYVGTLDAHLLALDGATGTLLWDQRVADYRDGYSITSAPIPVGNLIITGIAGGDFPTRGFLTAYDATSGAQVWRTYTIPAPGEPGSESWAGESGRTGGATTWGTGAFDPELGLLYWGTGNPAPDYNAERRAGDNLHSCSLLAIDVRTGRLAWHFQFSPHDTHDWDSIQTPTLFDADEAGKHSRLLAVGNRNGFYYVLNRETGEFVRGGSYAKVTWASGLTPQGRPIRLPNTDPTPRGTLVYPSTTGAANWWMQAYSPITQLSYLDVLERGGLFFSTETPPSAEFGRLFAGSAGRYVDNDFHYMTIRAIDPRTARIRWEYRLTGYSDLPRGGLLATAGNLLFGSDTSRLIALDATTGDLVWSFDTGGHISGPPVSYRVGERQFIGVAAGQLIVTFALPDQMPANR